MQVSWNAENIREVYYNDQGTTGQGDARFCVSGTTMPTLRIVFQDGTDQTVRLYLRTWIERPEMWIVLALSVLLFGLALITALTGRSGAAQTASRPAVDRLLKGIGEIVVLFVWTYVLLEVILRLYFGVFGTPNQKIAYLYSRDDINRMVASVIPLPGVDTGLSPYATGNNQLGLRGEPVTAVKPEGVYRIIAMGDSTTFGHFVAPQDTYPAQLEQVLREEYGYTNVEVINAGVSGYSSFQIMSNLETRYLALDPDLVIFYSVNNDARLRERAPDCYAGENALRGLSPYGMVASYRVEEPLSPSALYRFLSIQLGFEPDPSTSASLYMPPPVTCGEGQAYESIDNIAQNPPLYYERNLITIAGIAQIHQVRLMLATWTYRAGSRDLEAAYVQAIEDNNQIIRNVAAEYDIPLFDYAREMPVDENDWIDFMHMSPEGLRSQAESFAAFIDSQGWIPHPS